MRSSRERQQVQEDGGHGQRKTLRYVIEASIEVIQLEQIRTSRNWRKIHEASDCLFSINLPRNMENLPGSEER